VYISQNSPVNADNYVIQFYGETVNLSVALPLPFKANSFNGQLKLWKHYVVY